jgi:periodic tryptophan protein 2
MKQKKFRTFQPDVRCQLVCLEVDDNGEVVFAGAFDPYDVYSWSVQTGHLLQVISGHQGPLAALAFAQTTLVTASWDNTLKLHAIFARKLNVETLDHGSQVTALALNPAKTQVAVSTMKGEIFLW